MKKTIFSRQINQRIQLWNCRQEETDDGDLVEIWTPSVPVWAHIRRHKISDIDTREKDQIEIKMRQVPYSFQGFAWHGKHYRLSSGIFTNPEDHTWQFFAKNVQKFNEISII